jgi:hypothetical protein
MVARALVVRIHSDGSEEITIDGHHFHFDGSGGGYCVAHQSFDCVDRLTMDAWQAIWSAQESVAG